MRLGMINVRIKKITILLVLKLLLNDHQNIIAISFAIPGIDGVYG
jgi:hypothetical protein